MERIKTLWHLSGDQCCKVILQYSTKYFALFLTASSQAGGAEVEVVVVVVVEAMAEAMVCYLDTVVLLVGDDQTTTPPLQFRVPCNSVYTPPRFLLSNTFQGQYPALGCFITVYMPLPLPHPFSGPMSCMG